MKKCWKWSVLLPYIGILIFLNTAWADSVELGPVQNIHAVSEHTINRPSQATIIEIEWSLPDGYTHDAIEGYYYRFDQSESYEFDEFNTGELYESQKAISKDFDPLNDEFMYFHIAAVALNDDDDLIIGPTESIGPFRIDNVPPINVGVETAPVTYDRSIELSLIGESSNLEVFISNIGYVQSDTGWVPFESKMNWIVSEGDGTKSIFVQFRDNAGNISKKSTTTELIDAPTLSLQSQQSSPTNASTITVFANFSHPVTAFEQSQITVVNADIQLIGSADAYTILLQPVNDGPVRITIPENAAGGISQAQTFEIISDRTKPEIKSIDSNIPPYANASSLPWTITITTSETVSDFTLSDITVENASKDQLEILADNTYILTISPKDQEIVSISVLADQFEDSAGNLNTQSIQYTRTYDTKEPVISLDLGPTTIPLGSTFDKMYSVTASDFSDLNLTDQIIVAGTVDTEKIGEYILTYSVTDRAGNTASITRTVLVEESPFNVTIDSPYHNLTNAQIIPLTITSERALVSFDYTHISLDNAVIIDMTPKSETVCIVKIEPSADGKISAIIPEDHAFDKHGNGNNASNTFEITIDRKNPTVKIASNIVADYANTPCLITITIDEDIVDFEKSDIVVTNGDVDSLTGVDSPYLAMILPKDQGQVTISIPSGAFTDLAKNDNNSSDTISYVYDSVPPEVALSTSELSPTHAQLIHVEALLTEPVIEFNERQLNTSPNAAIADGSFQGSYTAYSFDLIPPENGGNISVTIDSGKIKDQAGNTNTNAATLTLKYEPLDYTLTVDTSDGVYMPGHEFFVSVKIRFSEGMTSIGYEVDLPDTWQYQSVGGINKPPTIQKRDTVEFSWINSQIQSNNLSFYYSVTMPDTEKSDPKQITAMVKYRHADGPENIEVASFDTRLQSIMAVQTVDDIWYRPEMSKKIQIQISESIESQGFNKFTAIGIAVNTPDDWTFDRAEGDGKPFSKATDTGKIEFGWYDLKDFSPGNPIELSYYIVPPAEPELNEIITATLKYRFAKGLEKTVQLDALELRQKDTTRPVVTIDSSIPEFSNISPWQITVLFSEPIQDFEYDDVLIELNNDQVQWTGSLNSMTESEYVLSFTPMDQGEISITVPPDIAFDFADEPNFNKQSLPYKRIFDNERPQIILNGNTEEYVNKGSVYSDPGIQRVTDNFDYLHAEDVETSGQVNTSAVGDYEITYSITDRAGNTGSTTRIVHVEEVETFTVHTEGGAYLPDNQFVLSSEMNFVPDVTNIEYEVELPDNWQFVSVWGNPMPDATTDNVSFGWPNTLTPVESISFVYTLSVPKGDSDDKQIAITVTYTHEGQEEQRTEIVSVTEQNLSITHAPKRFIYYTNGTVGIDFQIKLDKETNSYNSLSAVGLMVQLPELWSFYHVSNTNPSLDDVTAKQYPNEEDTGLIQFAWFDIKNNDIDMTYDIKTPTTTESEIITATVQYRFANGPKRCVETQDLTFTLSTKPSIASISPKNGETTNSGVITLTFTEDVLNFGYTDLTISNNYDIQENSFQEILAGRVFTFTIDVTEPGPFGFTINEGKLNDHSGETNPLLSYSFVYDPDPPGVDLSTSMLSPTSSQSIPITIAFTEAVSDFSESDLTLSNAKVEENSFMGSGSTYQCRIVPLIQGEFTVFIAENTVMDHAGNMNTASNKLILKYEPLDIIPKLTTNAGPYLPGHNYVVSVSMEFPAGMTSIGYEIKNIPETWTYLGIPINPDDVQKHSDRYEFYLKECYQKTSLKFNISFKVPESENEPIRHFQETVTYRYADGLEQTLDQSFDATIQQFIAEHSILSNYFLPGYLVPVTVRIQLTEETGQLNDFSSLGLYVSLPKDWKYERADGPPLYGRTDPEKGATGLLHFYWMSVDDQLSNQPINLTYYVLPSSADSFAELTSTVEYRFSDSVTQFKALEDLTFSRANIQVNHTCNTKYIDTLDVITTITYNGDPSTLKNMTLTPTSSDSFDLLSVKPPATLKNGKINLNEAPGNTFDIKYTLDPKSNKIDFSSVLTYTLSNIAATDISLTQTALPEILTSSQTDILATQEVENLKSTAGAYYYTPDSRLRITNSISSSLTITTLQFTVSLPEGVQLGESSIDPDTQSPLVFSVTSSSFWYDLTFTGSGKKEIFTEVTHGDQSVDIKTPLVFYDNLPPEPAIDHNIPEISNVSPMELTLTFSKPIVFKKAIKDSFSVTNAAIDSVETVNENLIYQLDIIPKNGDVTIIMLSHVIQDYIGNANKETEILSVNFDSTAPYIKDINLKEKTNQEMVPVTLTFSEPVVGFDMQDLLIENGTADSMNQLNSTTYLINIIPSEQGDVKIAITPEALQDNAGNTLSDSQETYHFEYDTIPPQIDYDYSPKTLNTVTPVTLNITLTEICILDSSHIKVTSGEVKSIESSGVYHTVTILPSSCGYLTIEITNIIDEAGNIQSQAQTIEILIDCIAYMGDVKSRANSNGLSDVNVTVVFPEDDIYPKSKTDVNGQYALHLPTMDEKWYVFKFEKQGYISQTFSNKMTPEEETPFVCEVPTMTLEEINAASYAYTIICTVTAETNVPTSSVKVISANSDSSDATAVDTYISPGIYHLYYDRKPGDIIVSASMGDLYAQKELSSNMLSGKEYHVTLNMEPPKRPDPEETVFETSKVISKESGGTVKLKSSSNQSIAEIEVLPDAMDKSAEVIVKTHAQQTSSFAAHSELIDINTDAAIRGELIVKIRTNVEIDAILSGRKAVFWANNPQTFLAGNVQEIPLESYFGLAQEPGFIRFRMNHLTTVAVGKTGLKDSNAGQRRCFISTLQSISFNPLIMVFLLTMVMGLIKHRISHR